MAAFPLPITWSYSERSSYRLSSRGPRWTFYGHNQERAAPASGPFIPRKKLFICKRKDTRDLSNIPSPWAPKRVIDFFFCLCVSLMCVYLCFATTVSPLFHRVPYFEMGGGIWLALIRYRPKKNPAVLAAVLNMAYSQEWSDSVGADGAEGDGILGEHHVVNVVSFSVWHLDGNCFLNKFELSRRQLVAHSLKRQHTPAYLALLAKTLT
ncbi:hypothetical protein F4776DRAFT_104567 [Hypoxylon sp. NC0597]|nr:hypothetical protein F4776DRAFT_104567 [Hypoxylon sp. NC0597]